MTTQRPLKRDQVWQRSNAEHTRESVAERWMRVANDEAVAVSRRMRASADMQRNLEGFWLCVLLLQRHADEGGLATRTIEQLQRMASSTLQDYGVKPRRSRLRFMPAALHVAMAAVAARDGATFSAAWRDELANHARRRDDIDDEVVNRIQNGLLSDDPLALIEQLMKAELAVDTDDGPFLIRIARARLLRLTGSWDAAAEALASVDPEAPALKSSMVWERASIAAARQASAAPLAHCFRVDRSVQTVRRSVDVWLWSHAERSKERIARQPRVATLRRRVDAEQQGISVMTLQCARILERCLTTGVPLARRLASLGQAVEQAHDIPEVDHRLLFWAAAVRWLVRVRRRSMAALAASLYHDACLRLSDGANNDVFGVLSDVSLPAASRGMPSSPAPPQGLMARQLEMAKMAASLGSHHIKHAVTRVLQRGRGEQSEDRRAAELGDIAAHFVGHLKGPLMKVGQLMSFYGLDLPADFTDTLSELSDNAEPIPFEQALEVLEQELGMPWQQLFSEFDRVPIGVGSIGQVHRARVKEAGIEVAVKIQFPNARHIIRSDIRSLRLMLPLFRHVLSSWDMTGIVDELNARLVEECDYAREAKSQTWFREQLQHVDDLVIPEVMMSLSSERVLTTQFFSRSVVRRVLRSGERGGALTSKRGHLYVHR